MTNNTHIIKTSELSYHYAKDVATLSGINLEVERGSIYGFLGPNGSGKTTTLSLVLGLLNMQQGKIEVFGQQLHSNRTDILKKVGSLVETPSLYGQLTAKENLDIYRNIYGASKEKVAEVLQIVNLSSTGKKLVKKFSLGMKQRLAIALALLPEPELLVLDEPSNGLDPAGIIELRELIKRLNKTYGMTIIISSHLLGEVEKMVSHVGIIFKGKMLFQGPLSDLKTFQQKASKVFIKTSDNTTACSLLSDYKPEMSGDAIAIAFEGMSQIASISRVLVEHNIEVYLLHPRETDLEQLFIDLTSAQS